MAWAPTTGTAPTTGYKGQGQTTVRWGTTGIAPGVQVSANVGVVLRFNQKALIENIKLPNGDGLTCTRIQLLDGMQWDVTVRDDTGLSGKRPVFGSTVAIFDAGRLLNATANQFTAQVVDSGWDTAPKQPGEFTFTVESLTLITAEGITGV